jgi:hypothetical protein
LPITGVAAATTTTDVRYGLIRADGGVYTFGDAQFHKSELGP